MPSPQDLIYKQAFDEIIKHGLTQRDAETAGAQAVWYWRRNMRSVDAVAQAVAMQKKISKK